jgi:hypothetical protein
MGRGPKPAKSKEAKRPVGRKSPKDDSAQVRDLEKRLAEALERQAEAVEQLQARDRELAEALEQQTATGEILRTISQSPTDYQPVFDTIVRNAAEVCAAHDAVLALADGEDFHHPRPARSPLALSSVCATRCVILRADSR